MDRSLDLDDGGGSAEFRVSDAAAGQHESEHVRREFRPRPGRSFATGARVPGRTATVGYRGRPAETHLRPVVGVVAAITGAFLRFTNNTIPRTLRHYFFFLLFYFFLLSPFRTITARRRADDRPIRFSRFSHFFLFTRTLCIRGR